MEERNDYNPLDLRQLMAGRTCFPDALKGLEPFKSSLLMDSHGTAAGEVLNHGLSEFRHNDNNNNNITSVVAPSTSVLCAGHQFGLEMEGCNNGGRGSARWPRQETLSLLEIRSRLDYKFKETNQKGAIWDEVSRIMWEEYGYQRSGRKCKEKFENLYKYYKKTKEGKSGRQDGKHYRFFRQLEALCGEDQTVIHESSDTHHDHLAKHNLLHPTTSNFKFQQENQEVLHVQRLCESLSQSNSSEFDTSSSINNDEDLSAIALMMKRSMEKKVHESRSLRRARKSWKAKAVEEFIESRMRRLMETQEVWMDKMLETIEKKEQERVIKDEEWRKEEVARMDQEYKFWANDQKAWIEARDTAFMEALQKFNHNKAYNNHSRSSPSFSSWVEPEISSFIQLRTSMEPRFQGSGYSKEYLWEEIVAKMACLGYDWSVKRCKETWDNISSYFNKSSGQNSRTSCCDYFQQFTSYHGQEIADQQNGTGGFPIITNCNCKIGNAVPAESNIHLQMGGKDLLWESHGGEA